MVCANICVPQTDPSGNNDPSANCIDLDCSGHGKADSYY